VKFDVARLAEEVRALPPSAWDPHPSGFVGNEAVRLVTPFGAPTDALEGAMGPTRHLRACPYIVQIMGTLGGVWGRSRLMGLAAGAEVPAHVDSNYYWRTHLRIHIPVITNTDVIFTCGDEAVHMAAGECWLFDSFRPHDVQNRGREQRIHLVIDTVGGERLADLIQAAKSGVAEDVPVVPSESFAEELLFERVNRPRIMSPWEMREHAEYLARHTEPHPALAEVSYRMERFICAWSAAWARFGESDEGVPTYRSLVLDVRRDLSRIRGGGGILLDNKQPLAVFLESLIFINALAPETKAVGAMGESMRASAAV